MPANTEQSKVCQWDSLDKATLAHFGREVMLCNQIHDRALMPLIAVRWNEARVTRQALDEWMGASPVYNARNRALHSMQGNGVDTIMKGFQLDIGAPHMWLKFHYDVRDADYGQFWLTSCGAYNHVRALTQANPAAETQICVHMEDPTFDATVMAVNAGARCRPVFRPPHGGDIPAEGPCRWEVAIEPGDQIEAVQFGTFTDAVRSSRAGQFQFSEGPASDDGMADYAGPFKRDFTLEDLCYSKLLTQVKEFALDVHLLQRASYLSLMTDYGPEVVSELIAEHCAAMAPVYQARLRRLFGIEGEDMDAILRLLQVDPHFVPEYTASRVELIDARNGRLWIGDCAAIDDGQVQGVLTDILAGKPNGLLQIVQAANPRASVSAITSDLPPGAVYGFHISIDPTATPAPTSPWAELAGMNGLLEADLSRHIYHYED
ncbi:hypothetical protein [Parahaliea aestuarii]|uniref:Uncharacterized protein n=1 Tax=Parahaliea aestuarii TaxID=1852021 RepID=A0A5C8ZTH6_9GAMM|nr:hypothetical protein [Parahaliea aestuarii]TXS91756.1 hypothetical protein FVW59_11435 [Parahaliea aestuarii]